MKTDARGSILVLAMWSLLMLTVFSVSLGFGVRQRAAILGRLTALDALYPIAYSGVEQAKSLIRADSNTDVDTLTDEWAKPAPRPAVQLWGGSFSLGVGKEPGIQDEERKINLNFTKAETLLRLFQYVSGLDRAKAEELVYCLLDWMDSDSFYGHPQYGAEDSDYDGLPHPYAAKDAPYETMDELLLVKGMTPGIFRQIRPFVTVYGKGGVNINTAPREVLYALGFDPKGADAITQFRAGSDGVEGTPDDNFFLSANTIVKDLAAKASKPLDAGQEAVVNSLLTAGSLDVHSLFFSVLSRGEYEKSGASIEVRAVVDRKGNVYSYHASEVRK